MDQFGLAVPVKLGQYPHLALSVPCPQSNVMSSVKCYFRSQTLSVKHFSLGQRLSPQSNMSSVKCYVLSQMLHRQSNVMSWVKCCIVSQRYVLSQMLHRQSNVMSSFKCCFVSQTSYPQSDKMYIVHRHNMAWSHIQLTLSKWMWNSLMSKHVQQRRNRRDQMRRLPKLHIAVYRYTGKYLAALQTSPLKWCRSPVRI